VAFTDDDVRVTADWVRVIKESFDAHPDVECVSGRIVPVWEAMPPAWLTERHWVGPLALQDYGDVPFLVDANRPLCLASANLALRRAVFDRVGGFLPTYARAEDSEFLLRYWRSGRPALYVPEMTVHAPVQAERLEKAYHRNWHVQTGSFARLAEELSASMDTARPATEFARLLGVPVFAFRELATEAFLWFIDTLRRRDADAFWHEGQIRELVGYMRESSALYRRTRRSASGLRADRAPRT
jgi:GT2 family glycosyltransferase